MGKRKRERRRKLVRRAARELSGFVLGVVAEYIMERLSKDKKPGRQEKDA